MGGKVSASNGWVMMVPGSAGWECWAGGAGGATRVDPGTVAKANNLAVASPTRTLYALPLWLPSSGNLRELCELELASRHLMRRGQAVAALEIERDSDRVLAMAVTTTDDSAFERGLIRAGRFEIPARVIDPEGADVVLWKEEGMLCFAFYRDAKCVFFASSGEGVVGAELAELIGRTAQRLQAEEVVRHLPQRVGLRGDFSEADAQLLADTLSAEVNAAPEPSPPRLPADTADLAPPAAVAHRERRRRTRKFAVVSMIVGSVYLALVAVMLLVLAVGEGRLRAAREMAEAERPQAEAAREESERWRAIRNAVDPSDFALDLFAAVAAALPAETVRFTQVSIGDGAIALSGEAAEVSQTYDMIERLKAADALSAYDWTAKPPDIAGRNVVRFEIEGRRADAISDSE